MLWADVIPSVLHVKSSPEPGNDGNNDYRS